MDNENNQTEDIKTIENENVVVNETDNQVDIKEYEAKFRRRFLSGLLIGALCTAFICSAFMITTRIFTVGSGGNWGILDDETSLKIRKLEALIDSSYYKKEVDKEAERDGLYKGLLESLDDPYSVYYTKDDLLSFQSETEGIYYGIGAYISTSNEMGMPVISKVMEGTPAQEAGLMDNDMIMEINKESTQGLTTEEVVSKIKGEEGTTVHLTISRSDAEDRIEVDVYRKKIEVPTVVTEMLDDEIGYLQITEFDDVTYNQFVEGMAQLKAENMKGLILDLRGNPGGSLTTVCDIADQLIAKGNEIVYTVDREGKRIDYVCKNDNKLDIPLVVLVNGYSASASEILAGAIKDYGLGKLVGTTTFGKGIVQSVYDLNDGTAVKLTVSSYYTPNGNNIHGIGIKPDVEIKLDAEAYAADKSDNQKDKAVEVLKELLDK